MLPLILPLAEQARRAAAEASLVWAWVSVQIGTDERVGRSQSDFPTKDLPATVEATREIMRRKGLNAHQGGGNIFYHKSTPRGPVIVQARPFAQRVVRLRLQTP